MNDQHDFRDEYATIAVVGFAHGVSHFFHLLLAPLFPWLMRDFSLSYTQAGATMTAFFVVSGIGQALAGFAVDRWGARRVLQFGIGCLTASGLVLAGAGSYAGLVVAAALAGLGNAVFHPADFTALNRHVTGTRLSHGFSVHALSGNLGWAAAPGVMAGIAAVAGWRSAALAAAALGAAALAVLWWHRHRLGDGEPAPAAKTAETPAGVFAFLGIGAIWLCFTFFLMVTLAFGAIQSFGIPLFQHLYAISTGLAATAVTAYLLGGAAGIALGGFLANRGGDLDRRIALVLGLAALLALFLATGIPPGVLLPVFTAAIGFCVGIAGPSRDLLVRRVATAHFGQGALGRVYGFVYSGLDAGLAISPLIFGVLMDNGRYPAAMVGIALFQAAAVLTVLTIGRRRPASARPT